MIAETSKRALAMLFGMVIILSGSSFLGIISFPGDATIIINEAKLNYTGHKQGSVFSVAWSPNGDRIVSGGEDRVAIIWNASIGSTFLKYEAHAGSVRSVDWAPNGQRVVSGSADRTILVWNPQTGGNVKSLIGHTDCVKSVAWSPDGSKIATSSQDHTARVWNWAENTTLTTFDGHNDIVSSVAWSPDGTKLASGGNDNRVRIWNALGGEEVMSLRGHGDSVMTVAWSPDGKKILSGSLDDTARIWDAETGELKHTFHGHSDGVLSATWFDDGLRIASGGEDSMIRVWNAETGEVLLNFTAHKDIVRSIAISPDEEKMVSGSGDHTARVWNLRIPPPAPTLEVPSIKLLRSSTVKITAGVPDYSGNQDLLIPKFQYKVQSSSYWKEQYLSTPVIQENEWSVDFTPGLNATLGKYDFRARLEDEQQLTGPWATEMDTIEVANNPPSAVIWSAPSEVFRAQKYLLTIAVADIETPPEDMLLSIEYGPVQEDIWETDIFTTFIFNTSSGMWNTYFTFPLDTTPGQYEFRTRCADKALGVSDWDLSVNPVVVANNPPDLIRFDMVPSTVRRGESTRMWLDVTDIEEGNILDDVEVEIKGPLGDWEPIDFSLNRPGNNYTALYTSSLLSENGEHELRVRLKDAEGDRSEWLSTPIPLMVINNHPRVTETYNEFGLYGDKKELFYLTWLTTDLEDPDSSLIWEIYSSPSPLYSASMINSTWLEIVPSADFSPGKGTVRLKVTDSDGDSAFKDIYIDIMESSDRPDIDVVLNYPMDGTTVGVYSTTLSWDITYEKSQVKYDLYWGDSLENVSLLYRGLNENNLVMENLVNNRTYWWKVAARVYDVPYTFESPSWSFTVNIGFLPLHNVALSLENKMININVGDTVYLNLTLSNVGNVPEEVELVILGALKDYVSILDSVLIDPGETRGVPFTIRAHESLSLDKYVLTIKADFGDLEKTKRLDVQIGSVDENPDSSSSALRNLTLVVVLLFLIGELVVFLFWISRKRKNSKMDDILPTPIYLSPYEAPDLYTLAPQSYTQQESEIYGEVPSQSYSGEPSPYEEPAIQPYSQPAAYMEVPALMPDASIQPQQVLQVPMLPSSQTSPIHSHDDVPQQLMLAPAPEAAPIATMQKAPQSQGGIETPTAETVEIWMESLPGEYTASQAQQETSPEMYPSVEMQGNIPEGTSRRIVTEEDMTEHKEIDSLSLEDDMSALKDMISNVIRKDLPSLPPASSDSEPEEYNNENAPISGLQNIDIKLAMLDSLTEDYIRK